MNKQFCRRCLLGGGKLRKIIFLSLFIIALVVFVVCRTSSGDDASETDDEQVAFIRSFFLKQVPVSCPKLFGGDGSAVRTAVDFDENKRKMAILPDEVYLNVTADCDAFLRAREYSMVPLSEEEEGFPIAFSINLHQHVEEFERLLRLIYQPQNVYCVYVDAKADPMVLEATESIVRCFSNVFIAENRTRVMYGSYSLLEAMSLTCSQQLLQYEWKYYINLVSQMFPLRTNRELVQLFSLLGGFNLVEATDPKREWRQGRWHFRHAVPNNTGAAYNLPVKTSEQKDPPPHKLTYVVGATQIAVSRELVEFVFTSTVVRDYMHWLQDTNIPDEAFWTTVNWNMAIHPPGGNDLGNCKQSMNPDERDCHHELVRYVRWGNPCGQGGRTVRGVGILNIYCLPELITAPHIAANKFYLDYHKSAYECMEEWYINRTREGIQLAGSWKVHRYFHVAAENFRTRNDSFYAAHP